MNCLSQVEYVEDRKTLFAIRSHCWFYEIKGLLGSNFQAVHCSLHMQKGPNLLLSYYHDGFATYIFQDFAFKGIIYLFARLT